MGCGGGKLLDAPSFTNLKQDQSRGRRASFYSVGGSQRCQSAQCTGVDESGGFMGKTASGTESTWVGGLGGSGWAAAQQRCEVKDLKQGCRQRQMWRLSWISAALLMFTSVKSTALSAVINLQLSKRSPVSLKI